MQLREARIDDAEDLARLHVDSWIETYRGLLPDEEIARYDLDFRIRQWVQILGQSGERRIAILPNAGFAMMGPQREDALAADFPDELYAIYLMRAAQGCGHGRALLECVRGVAAFSCCVVAGNLRAERFYLAQGGRELLRRAERIGAHCIEEIVFGFAAR